MIHFNHRLQTQISITEANMKDFMNDKFIFYTYIRPWGEMVPQLLGSVSIKLSQIVSSRDLILPYKADLMLPASNDIIIGKMFLTLQLTSSKKPQPLPKLTQPVARILNLDAGECTDECNTSSLMESGEVSKVNQTENSLSILTSSTVLSIPGSSVNDFNLTVKDDNTHTHPLLVKEDIQEIEVSFVIALQKMFLF